MPNLSWSLFKGYYAGFDPYDWVKDEKNKVQEDRIQNHIKQKHFPFVKDEFKLLIPEAVKEPIDFTLKLSYPGLLYGAGYGQSTGVTGSLQLGYELDYTTGMPVIHGSSIKGAIRARFPGFTFNLKKRYDTDEVFRRFDLVSKSQEIKMKKEAEIQYQKAEFIFKKLFSRLDDKREVIRTIYLLEQQIFEGLNVKESQENDIFISNCKGKDLFFEAFPVKCDHRGRLFGEDYITPHDENGLKNPTPLPFLKVMPGVEYAFRFELSDAILPGTKTNHVISDEKIITKKQKSDLFRDILCDYGLGAKTNVGYGQFEPA